MQGFLYDDDNNGISSDYGYFESENIFKQISQIKPLIKSNVIYKQ